MIVSVIDRYTCSGYTKKGMNFNSQTRGWKWSTTIVIKWTNNYKLLTIIITSINVMFRALAIEKVNKNTNGQKIWRINKEGSMLDNTSTQSTKQNHLHLCNLIMKFTKKTVVDYITSQYKAMNLDNSSPLS